jgi:drug/metabolite transporter (DMT)-like permease
MILGIIFAILVVFFWAYGEVSYSKLSKSLDRANVYFYQYLARSIIYLSVAAIFDITLFTKFNYEHLMIFLPIILCDLFGSYVINIAVSNGKLSVVSPIMAAYPIVDILLGLILLKEKIGILEIGLSGIIAVSIVALAMSQKKSKKSPHPIKGIIFAVVYMLLVAFSIYFEKNAYVTDFSVYEFYFYKGFIYLLTSGFFMLVIGITPVKIKKPNLDILRGAGITPIGNVLNSFALSFGNMIIVTPISSIYSVLSNFLSRRVLKEKVSLKESICISLILLCTISLVIIGLI